MKQFLTVFFILIYSFGFSQNKITVRKEIKLDNLIKGTIKDAKTLKAIPFVTIIYGTKKSVTSDENGNYIIYLEPGKYTLNVSYIGYKKWRINNLLVKKNNITFRDILLTKTKIK